MREKRKCWKVKGLNLNLLRVIIIRLRAGTVGQLPYILFLYINNEIKLFLIQSDARQINAYVRIKLGLWAAV